MGDKSDTHTSGRNPSGSPEMELTATEAASRLGVSERTIRRAIASGKLPATKDAGVFRIALTNLEQWRRGGSTAADLPAASRGQSHPSRPLPQPQPRSATTTDSREFRPVNQLPAPLTQFIGRVSELETLTTELRRPGVRLVTLTGPGGVGKTRLALQTATTISPHFPDGVHFVGLASIRTAALILPAIAGAINVRELGDEPLSTTITNALDDKRILLVLDNVEQIIEAAPIVAGILMACPRLSVLATSRVRLRITGEREVVLPPLRLAADDEITDVRSVEAVDSVRLFVTHAQAARPGFSLDASTIPMVTEICRAVDGLPLGIELAAARLRHLSLGELVGQMERRLPILAGGPRDHPARLQTMRAAIAWTYDLLPASLQTFFRRVAIFTGSFTLAGAAAVANVHQTGGCTTSGELDFDHINMLGTLIDYSLLQVAASAGPEPRYQMLETVREYGLERLAEAGEESLVREAHAVYFLLLAEEAEWKLRGPEQGAWLARIDIDQPNLRAASAWLQSTGQLEAALRLAGALGWFWRMRDHLKEGLAWLETLLAAAADAQVPIPPGVLAKAMSGAGTMAAGQSDFVRAQAFHAQSLAHAEAAEDNWWAALAMMNHGVAAKYLGEIELAELKYAQSLERFPADPTDWGTIFAQSSIGTLALDRGDFERAEIVLSASVTAWKTIGDTMMYALDMLNLGEVRLRQGDTASAERLIQESLDYLEEVNERRSKAYGLGLLGELHLQRRSAAEAVSFFSEALKLNRDLGDSRGIAQGIEGIAMAMAQSQPDTAAWLFGAVAALREDLGTPRLPTEDEALRPFIQAAEHRLGPAAFAAALRAGQQMPREAMLAQALAITTPTDASPAPIPAPVRSGTDLSRREQEVLRLLAGGDSNLVIAAKLNISVATVARHVANIYDKLGVNSRAKATAIAFRDGLR